VLHSDELWALPGYEGLPRVTPEFPIVSMDDDDASWGSPMSPIERTLMGFALYTLFILVALNSPLVMFAS
jgi:hypothetical protein